MNPAAEDKLIDAYTDNLLGHLADRCTPGRRTFGFEYEFLPRSPLDLSMMERLYSVLPQSGFHREKNVFRHGHGLIISFEPGGQIEYHSMPLLPDDTARFEQALAVIARTNQDLHTRLGIDYVATGYIPGRADAPLCLDSERYRRLHDRLAFSGTRGREMMKGSASIHLHAAIQSLDDLVPLFLKLCDLSRSDAFKMGRQRRDIWEHTDPCRCGLPFDGISADSSPRDLIRQVVTVAVHADVLGENVAFGSSANTGFEDFLQHLTTIFTDVRLNIKGPTWEMRTPDSMPQDAFVSLWKRFIGAFPPANDNHGKRIT